MLCWAAAVWWGSALVRALPFSGDSVEEWPLFGDAGDEFR